MGSSLALVPQGHQPVAVFPPYPTQRSVPAVAVIFSERPQKRLQKRSISETIYSFMGNMERSLLCLKPKIYRHFTSRNKRQAFVDSYDDCFEGTWPMTSLLNASKQTAVNSSKHKQMSFFLKRQQTTVSSSKLKQNVFFSKM